MENWTEVLGYEGLYEVSDLGRVRSLDRPKVLGQGRGHGSFHRGRVLSPSLNRGGYAFVTLSKNSQTKTHTVHKIVLQSFVGVRPEKAEARHLNGVRADNRLDNLLWGTRSENTFDQVKDGTHRNSRKTHCMREHEFIDANLISASLRHGQRSCKACFYARRYLASHPELDMLELSNQYYRRVLAGELK